MAFGRAVGYRLEGAAEAQRIPLAADGKIHNWATFHAEHKGLQLFDGEGWMDVREDLFQGVEDTTEVFRAQYLAGTLQIGCVCSRAVVIPFVRVTMCVVGPGRRGLACCLCVGVDSEWRWLWLTVVVVPGVWPIRVDARCPPHTLNCANGSLAWADPLW